MPCMSYDDSPRYAASDWKEKTDMLARIACKALTELEKLEPSNELFSNKEAATWWEAHKKADAEAALAKRKALEAREAKAALKASALSKLTDAERKALGVK